MIIDSVKSTLRVILITAEVTSKRTLTDAFYLFGILVQPLIIAMLAIWMLRDKGGDYGIFVVIGSGMSGLWTTMIFVSGNSITQERWTGTLELLVGQPTPITYVIYGKNIANVLQSLLSMLASYLLASIIFDIPLVISQPLNFVVSLLLTVVAFVSFGLVIAPIFVMNPSVQRWQNTMEYPIYILSGFLFPIALLPGWTTPLSYILAPYWAARALHGATSGNAPFSEMILSWGMMLIFSLVYFFVSRHLFRVMLRKARVDATLAGQ